MQNSYQRPGSFNILPLVIKNLLIINGLLFLASITPTISDYILRYLPLYYFELPYFGPWQLVTYQFIHDPGGIGHLFFNMLSLWMFGSILENFWGARKFIIFYLASGIGAAVFHMLYTYIAIHYMPQLGAAPILIGASGSIYGLLVAYAFMFPDSYINLYFFIPIKAKYFMWILIAIDLFGGFFSNDNVAHFAHIGGAITGFIILLIWKRSGKLWGK